MFKKLILIASFVYGAAYAGTAPVMVAVNANNESEYDIACSYILDLTTKTSAEEYNDCRLTNNGPGSSAYPYITFSSVTSINPKALLTLYITNLTQDSVPLCSINISLSEAKVHNFYSYAYCSLSTGENAYTITIRNGASAK